MDVSRGKGRNHVPIILKSEYYIGVSARGCAVLVRLGVTIR